MASLDQARQAIVDQIVGLTPQCGPEMLLQLAEAYAWLIAPDNAHGD